MAGCMWRFFRSEPRAEGCRVRYQGRVTSWKDEKGFGFVTPNGGGDRIFLHVSDFSERHKRPEIGDLVTYEIGKGDRGRMKAIAATLTVRPSPSVHRSRRSRPQRTDFMRNVAMAVALCTVGFTGYEYLPKFIRSFAPPQPQVEEKFQCSGKTRCTQMKSCEEATFYLENCPNTTMDGDHDGIPCEDQWCH
jgi:cold shock CspA family protein